VGPGEGVKQPDQRLNRDLASEVSVGGERAEGIVRDCPAPGQSDPAELAPSAQRSLFSWTALLPRATSVRYWAAETSATSRKIFKWSVGVEGDRQPTKDRRARASARARQVQMEGPGLTPWTTPSEGMPSVRMPSRSWRWLAAMSSAVVLYRAACLREDGLLGWARRYDSESSARAEHEQRGGGEQTRQPSSGAI
jgi:hypothetical protein